MVILNRVVILFSLLLMLTACGSKNTFVAAEPGLQHSVVYLYRVRDVANAMLAPDIYVDGEKVVALKGGEYQMLKLGSGEHEIRLAAIEDYTPASEKLFVVKPARVHYLRLDASMKMQTGLRYSAYQRSFKLNEVEAAQAQSEIASCLDVAAVEQKNAVAGEQDKKATGGEAYFSTDKTTNPFGH